MEAILVPVRIGHGRFADGIQAAHLIGIEPPTESAQILPELLFIAGSDDHGSNRRPLKEPVDRNLRHGFTGFRCDLFDTIHDAIEMLFGNLGTAGGGGRIVKSTGFGHWLISTDFARESAPTKGTPNDGSDALIQCKWHEFPLIVAPDEGVVGLVSHMARQVVLI